MDVIVRTINVNGKPLKGKDRKAGPSYSGKLRVREDRLNLLGRAFVQAELVSKVDGQESLILPPLVDAHLLWVEASGMRITGMEVVESIQYYQTWEIEVRSC